MSTYGSHPITLFTQSTPNGFPISVALEELGLKYNVKPLEFSKNEQKEVGFASDTRSTQLMKSAPFLQDWYIKICPNGRCAPVFF